MVKVNVEVPPAKIGFAAKALTMLGGRMAVSEAVPKPVEVVLIPLSVDETNPVTFVCGPAVVAVTLTCSVQELFAGMLAPVGDPNVRVVAAAAGAHVGVPPQVVEAAGVPAT